MGEVQIEAFERNNYHVIIDVRSPKEFQESAIPYALNIPLLSNEERELIGKLYKEKGEKKAKWYAMEIVSPKIPALLNEIKKVTRTHETPLIYCWRGGMRSKVVATFCAFAGLQADRLVGGYKAYRTFILQRIPEMIPPLAIVIHGGTGVGKTEVLHVLKEKGYPTVDLEKIANHRGSIFGGIGQGKANSQKMFDGLLYEQLKRIEKENYFFIEGESRRIGKAIQPEKLLQTSKQGKQLHLEAKLTTRIERILAEYTTPYIEEEWYVPKVLEAFSYIQKGIKNKQTVDDIISSIKKEDFHRVVELLLVEYYDPRYNHSKRTFEGDFLAIDGNHVEQAVETIESLVQDDLSTRQGLQSRLN